MTTNLALEPRHFVRHAVETTVAMLVGMALFAPLWTGPIAVATNMTVTMMVWMFYRGTAVVILTGRGRPPHLQQALHAGAKGFLPKGSPVGRSPT